MNNGLVKKSHSIERMRKAYLKILNQKQGDELISPEVKRYRKYIKTKEYFRVRYGGMNRRSYSE